ncbi:hypothetical protein SJ05684_c06990 [Sinorhizobium sojae CCBAU 05684]|uniref:Uncharacterized protein n=1 Tax=Sinorhizobium sojae CCBAU 05684 TaxID=716928 RepID=A0A249P8U5_9HYPH|nr:hypothetical protein SJ05684_c06990 [Sinorhizobium sojae CCBAU 05684]
MLASARGVVSPEQYPSSDSNDRLAVLSIMIRIVSLDSLFLAH